jgi:hypothetical protein
MSEESDRSLARIEIADLLRLAALAAHAEAELFRRNPDGSGRYAGRLLGRALCQGAALHYVNGRNGVKDFDVRSFYAQYDDWPFPARWRGTRDFGPSKFGRYARDAPRYSGRRVDLLGRSLRVEPGADLTEAVRRYLTVRRTRSAKELAAKAVVLIDPESRVGEIVWPLWVPRTGSPPRARRETLAMLRWPVGSRESVPAEESCHAEQPGSSRARAKESICMA